MPRVAIRATVATTSHTFAEGFLCTTLSCPSTRLPQIYLICPLSVARHRLRRGEEDLARAVRDKRARAVLMPCRDSSNEVALRRSRCRRDSRCAQPVARWEGPTTFGHLVGGSSSGRLACGKTCALSLDDELRPPDRSTLKYTPHPSPKNVVLLFRTLRY
ncbi:hypothetical protein MRX96_015249 [Rhipicephalus microplus]